MLVKAQEREERTEKSRHHHTRSFEYPNEQQDASQPTRSITSPNPSSYLSHSPESNLTASLKFIYQTYLSTHSLPQAHQSKISLLLSQPITPGSSIALFQMLYYFKQALHEELLREVQDKMMEKIGETKDETEIQCYAEVIAECAVENQEICQHFTQALLEEQITFELALLVLSNQGIIGLAYLIDLANRDIFGLSPKILDYLSRTQTIILSVLVPTLIQDASDPNLSRHRDFSLAALNRLAPILTQVNLNQLALLLNDPSIDKKLLLAAIRCAGLQGQQTILDIINSQQFSQPVVSLALSMLSWRVPAQPALRIRTIQYTLDHCFLPGRLYQYEGSLQPWDFTQEHCPDSLCLSMRDFLSHLEFSLRQRAHLIQPRQSNRHLSLLVQILHLEQNQPIRISEEVIVTLTHQLKHKSAAIKQIALLQLGNIGHSQASSALQPVAKCLHDGNSCIRSAACWTIARIASSPHKKLELRLNELMKDHYWKVRTSACITLGLILKHPQPATVETLIRVLQDGSIPKSVVCQTLARIGAQQLLLEILKGTNNSDFKLRKAIINSFQFCPLHSPHLNSIVQQILKHSRDAKIQTRELCLLTLSALRQKTIADNSDPIVHLQSKHLLPFFYCFLDDPSPKIRSLAAQNLLNFGPQAQLLFIQGMTKGQPLAKIECIRCLGKLGVQNFRAIILGLRDEDERVRRAAGDTILENFTAADIIDQFGCRQTHSISLICNLKEISNTQPPPQLHALLLSILSGLQGHSKSIPSFDQNLRLN